MNAVKILPAALCLALSGPAFAENALQEPRAAARLISAPHDAQRWYGVGDVVANVQICVESNTGRFNLRLSPQLAALAPSGAAEYEVSFSTSAGERSTQIWNGRGDLLFGGRAVGADCGAAGNVSVEFRIKQRSLVAAVAGAYVNQVRYAVDPA